MVAYFEVEIYGIQRMLAVEGLADLGAAAAAAMALRKQAGVTSARLVSVEECASVYTVSELAEPGLFGRPINSWEWSRIAQAKAELAESTPAAPRREYRGNPAAEGIAAAKADAARAAEAERIVPEPLPLRLAARKRQPGPRRGGAK